LPQEDEFALMNLGAPTLYSKMMFPQNGFVDENTLSDCGFLPEQKAKWQYLMDWFLKALTYKSGKPLILKSPPHTGRIQMLRGMYPDAKFVHISRDPRKLFPSTMRLWKSLDSVQGLQAPISDDQLEPFVFRSLRTMYESYERGKQGLSESQLCEVSYEELIKKPIDIMQRIYEQLGLEDFDTIREGLQAKTQMDREYKTNRFALDSELERRILIEWKDYAERYEYL
jgi:hypothetical protein